MSLLDAILKLFNEVPLTQDELDQVLAAQSAGAKKALDAAMVVKPAQVIPPEPSTAVDLKKTK